MNESFSKLKSEIKHELIRYYDDLKFEIDIKVQETLKYLDQKLNKNLALNDRNKLEIVKQDLLNSNSDYVGCIDQACDKNMIDLDKYFLCEGNLFDKEEIKSQVLCNYCIFVDNDWEPNRDHSFSQIQLGYFFSLDWYANENVRKYIEFLLKSFKFNGYRETNKFKLEKEFFYLLLAFNKLNFYQDNISKFLINQTKNEIMKIEKTLLKKELCKYDTLILKHPPILNNLSIINENAFTFLENLTNLRIILADSIEIKENAFNNLTKLEELELSLFKPQNVSTITLNQSKFKRISINLNSFNGLTNLKRLGLKSFEIECLCNKLFSSLSKLEILVFENCKLNMIEPNAFDQMKNLNELCLNGSFVNENNFSSFTKLSSIDSLQVSDIKFMLHNNDEFDNKLKQFIQNFSSFKKLRVCDTNLIKLSCDKTLKNLFKSNLKSLCIDINQKSGSTDKFHKSYNFSIHQKGIHVLPQNHTKTIDSISNKILKDLNNLEILELKSSGLFQIESNSFKYLFNLTILNLSNNSIVELNKNAFNGLESLIELDLSKNNIENIDKDVFNIKNLKQLSLLHNPIRIKDLDEFILKHGFNQNIIIKCDFLNTIK